MLESKTAKKFTWNTDKQKYVYKNNRAITDKTLYKSVSEKIADLEKKVVSFTAKFLDNQVTFEVWQQELTTLIRDGHVDMLRFGKGGKEYTYANDYLEVARELKNTQYDAFKTFSSDIASGSITPAKIRSRATLYARSIRYSFELGRQRTQANNIRARRKLGACKDHCSNCITYASWGYVKLEDLIIPTKKCPCGVNCCCSVEYANLAETLAA